MVIWLNNNFNIFGYFVTSAITHKTFLDKERPGRDPGPAASTGRSGPI